MNSYFAFKSEVKIKTNNRFNFRIMKFKKRIFWR